MENGEKPNGEAFDGPGTCNSSMGNSASSLPSFSFSKQLRAQFSGSKVDGVALDQNQRN